MINKNSPSSTSASNRIVGANNAVLNQLALRSPQRCATPLAPVTPLARLDHQSPSATPPVRHLQEVVELTIGTDPQALIRRAETLVKNADLRDFLRSIMAERDVNQVLTVLCSASVRAQRLPIDRLRSVAQYAGRTMVPGSRARDTLYVAVMVSGIEYLLGRTVQAPHSSRDVIRTVVRDALHTLTDRDEAMACDLRNGLGWGNEDDMGDRKVRDLQYQIQAAVRELRNGMERAQPRIQG